MESLFCEKCNYACHLRFLQKFEAWAITKELEFEPNFLKNAVIKTLNIRVCRQYPDHSDQLIFDKLLLAWGYVKQSAQVTHKTASNQKSHRNRRKAEWGRFDYQPAQISPFPDVRE